jgi:hypothetical protein
MTPIAATNRTGRGTVGAVGRVGQAKRRAMFLDAYARCGTIWHAAQEAGIHRNTHYSWLANDADYAEAFAEAEERAIEALEREVRRRAVEGVDEPVFYKGEQCGTIRRYSDTLLIFALKRFRPEYREHHRVQVDASVTHHDASALERERVREMLTKLAERERELGREQAAIEAHTA